MSASSVAAARVARECFGRLVAYLAVRSRDLAGAEDALAGALLAALETWPRDGVPSRPEAWLLTAARRRLFDGVRHAGVQAAAAETIRLAAEEAAAAEASTFPDERLRLLFACAHPAIDETIRTALMLQTVLGLDAARIATAFAVGPATMGQRLVRAKAKLRDAGIAFALPEPEDVPGRLDAVLDAIYAAYGLGWDDLPGTACRRFALTGEAIWLGQLVVRLLPEAPEARGLLGLMLFCDSRRQTRRNGNSGAYVPLAEQDPSGWSLPMIAAAERHLRHASRAGRPGRYQLEAAIQSVHADRRVTGVTRWDAIAVLYEGLVDLSPTIGAFVGRAAARGEADGAAAGLAAATALDPATVAAYQPFWAVQARLLARLGRIEEASAAYTRAADLVEDPAIAAYLLEQRRRLTD